jgi:hypothetical protein
MGDQAAGSQRKAVCPARGGGLNAHGQRTVRRGRAPGAPDGQLPVHGAAEWPSGHLRPRCAPEARLDVVDRGRGTSEPRTDCDWPAARRSSSHGVQPDPVGGPRDGGGVPRSSAASDGQCRHSPSERVEEGERHIRVVRRLATSRRLPSHACDSSLAVRHPQRPRIVQRGAAGAPGPGAWWFSLTGTSPAHNGAGLVTDGRCTRTWKVSTLPGRRVRIQRRRAGTNEPDGLSPRIAPWKQAPPGPIERPESPERRPACACPAAG